VEGLVSLTVILQGGRLEEGGVPLPEGEAHDTEGQGGAVIVRQGKGDNTGGGQVGGSGPCESSLGTAK
jgi:hypothetical protein